MLHSLKRLIARVLPWREPVGDYGQIVQQTLDAQSQQIAANLLDQNPLLKRLRPDD